MSVEKITFARLIDYDNYMNVTKIVRPFLHNRVKAVASYDNKAIALQHDVMMRLVQKASHTLWGEKHNFAHIHNYTDFCSIPIQTYDDIKADVDRMRHGEKDVLWPGEVKWYAKSSGTTNDKSKFIPVTTDGLKHIHYRGGTDCVAQYLCINPQSRFFTGKGLILGGSHSPNYNVKKSLVGDLSAILIENMTPFAEYYRTPNKKIALLSDFEEKRDKIARMAMLQNVTNLSGVPSWMLSVLNRVLELKGTDNLLDVWPNLEVFFHGGVAFTPYREQYKHLIPSTNMHYMETYNASEGFFGIQTDPTDAAMTLMVDYDVFYEFIPMDQFGSERPTIVPLEGVELNKNYAIVISSSCGLWRYILGDTVKFTNKNPYKFVITGRTKHFINAFGEELMVDNAEKGLAMACKETGAQVLDYTAAPVFMTDDAKCRHQWVIEFTKMPDSVEHFAKILDESLQQINSDYEAKRYKDITLQALELVVAKRGLFHDWLKSKGKLGGQHKVPRLSNSREYIDELLSMNS